MLKKTIFMTCFKSLDSWIEGFHHLKNNVNHLIDKFYGGGGAWSLVERNLIMLLKLFYGINSTFKG